MSCILRVCGDNLNIDSLLSIIDLQPNRIWRKGQPRRKNKPNSKLHQWSGATFIVSDADFDEFDAQIADATHFLKKNQSNITKATTFEGVDSARLDFAIEFRDVAIHGDILPNNFLKVAGDSGVEVLLSHYPYPEETEES